MQIPPINLTLQRKVRLCHDSSIEAFGTIRFISNWLDMQAACLFSVGLEYIHVAAFICIFCAPTRLVAIMLILTALDAVRSDLLGFEGGDHHWLYSAERRAGAYVRYTYMIVPNGVLRAPPHSVLCARYHTARRNKLAAWGWGSLP